MSEIHGRRVIIGGLLAGLIMNVAEAVLHAAILREDTAAVYETLHASTPSPATTLPLLVATTFILGITSMWLYAVIYSRFRDRYRAAFAVALVVWVLSHIWSGVYLGAGYAGIIPPRLALIPVIWGLFETGFATLIGSLVYTSRLEG
jgi:hypothetical protein